MSLDVEQHTCMTKRSSSSIGTDTVQMLSSCLPTSVGRQPTMPATATATTVMMLLSHSHEGARGKLPPLIWCVAQHDERLRRQQL